MVSVVAVLVWFKAQNLNGVVVATAIVEAFEDPGIDVFDIKHSGVHLEISNHAVEAVHGRHWRERRCRKAASGLSDDGNDARSPRNSVGLERHVLEDAPVDEDAGAPVDAAENEHVKGGDRVENELDQEVAVLECVLVSETLLVVGHLLLLADVSRTVSAVPTGPSDLGLRLLFFLDLGMVYCRGKRQWGYLAWNRTEEM